MYSFHIVSILTCFAIRSKPINRSFRSAESFVWNKLFAGGACFKSIFSNSVKMGNACMLGLANNLKILNSIIKLVPVDMVNYFMRKWKKLSSDVLFHNVPMLANKLAVDIYNPISIADGSVFFIPNNATVLSPLRKSIVAFHFKSEIPWLSAIFSPLIKVMRVIFFLHKRDYNMANILSQVEKRG